MDVLIGAGEGECGIDNANGVGVRASKALRISDHPVDKPILASARPRTGGQLFLMSNQYQLLLHSRTKCNICGRAS